jgi:Uma2 family endonuclease
MSVQHAGRMHEEYWEGADLVMEVVSADGRDRDRVRKRQEYAEGGIPEYWIIDPFERTITVLKLNGCAYTVDGQYRAGQVAKSVVLDGFSVDVDDVWSAEKGG